ncbi:DMT family transporter [Gynuella sunshinyii]|uniref:Permeases of the drug/metabolite transporter (DMT) superfamily n=1 Tax=Gynuella sunshinyii YC6258 TaxID=1445510 RepID=A0A0C5VEJ7_9GAMM|nr:DMT family transporter [Gynuella sunshinyii]AJQ97700.1 permeases of the drug/metabolite transporter (DMT) superfamily [Gynuella sunshinyii YC6258]
MTMITSTHSGLGRAELSLLLVAIFWGTSYGLTQTALSYAPVMLFIAIRFLLTHLALVPRMLREFKQGRNPDWIVAIPTGLILLAIFSCEVTGVAHTSAANAAFLISLNVLMTPFVEYLFTGTRPDSKTSVLALSSVLGVYGLTREHGLTWSLNSGDWLIIAAAALRAVMITTVKRLMKDRQLATASLTALQALIVATGAIVFLLCFTEKRVITIPLEPQFWGIMLYLVGFCTLFAFFVQNRAVQYTSASKVALLMGSEPLFGALFAVIWLNESLSLTQAFGGLLITFSTVLATRR